MTEAWVPGTFTPSLTGTEDFVTDGDKLLRVIDLAWSSPESDAFALDEWQRWLLRHVLERYPDDWPDARLAGRLRFREVVVSLGRQNGKSVIGAIMGLYGLLLMCKGPEVVSVASTREQAEIIYKRVRYVLENNPSLLRRFKATGTRGITSRLATSPASYVVKAGAESGLQGYPISLGLADELHLWKPETWDAILLGMSAKVDAMLFGITTAGDENSALLKRLYVRGEAAEDERFGFFRWQAVEGSPVDDPQALIDGNPAIACGRLPLEQELAVVRSMPEAQVRRYRHNLFIASEASWLPLSQWHRLGRGSVPERVPLVFAVERAENWTYATVTAAGKVGGKVHTEVVASLVNPSVEQLDELCRDLWRRFKPMRFLMRSAVLKDLATRLRERGVAVEYLTQDQMKNVCATAYALIAEGRVVHAGDWLVDSQMPKAVSKNSGEGWLISPRDSVGDVDAVMATVIGLYGAETIKPQSPALFVA